MISKQILPPTYLFIFILLSIVLHLIFPIKTIITSPYTYIGIPLIVLGIGINIWADNIFKRASTTVKPNEKPRTLITQGPFRLSRHPMYLGFVLILLGIAVLQGSLTPFITPIAMFMILELDFIPKEEKNLQETFGKNYLDYKKRVGRWIYKF